MEESVSVEVVPFEVNLARLVQLPCGDTIRLNASVVPNGAYFLTEWTTSTGNIIAGKQSLQPLIDDAGVYEIEVLSTVSSLVCRDKKSVQVELVAGDSLAIMLSEGLHCNWSEARLIALDEVNRSEFLYQWTTKRGNIISNQEAPNILVNQAGVYELSRIDVLGICPTTASIEIFDEKITDFVIDLTPPSCEQSEGTILITEVIGGFSPYRYSIDDGITFQPDRIFSNLTGGSYSLIAQDANGCQLAKDINFASFIPIQLTLPERVNIEKGKNYELPLLLNLPDSLVESIQWTPSRGLSCGDCATPVLTSNQIQVYQVKVRDKNGCQEQASIQITLFDPSDVYIPSVFSPNGDGQNDIFLVFSNTQVVKKIRRLSIFDRYGNLVFNRSNLEPNLASVGWNGRFKGQEMGSGVYVYWTEMELLDGRTKVFQGAVSLMR